MRKYIDFFQKTEKKGIKTKETYVYCKKKSPRWLVDNHFLLPR